MLVLKGTQTPSKANARNPVCLQFVYLVHLTLHGSLVARLTLLVPFVGSVRPTPVPHCLHTDITPVTQQFKNMAEIRTVILDQWVMNTQLLEVMTKQQNKAQTAATAAMTAQNEALKNFQDTIASIVVPLSQRAPTAVHLPENDPKFPDWDGDRAHLLLWLNQVDQIRQTKEIPDTVAVRFAGMRWVSRHTGISKKRRQTGQRLS